MLWRMYYGMSLTAIVSIAFVPVAGAVSASFIEDFEDGTSAFQGTSTQSHQIGGGVSDHTWSVVNTGGDKALRSHTFLHTLNNDSASLVYASEFFPCANVPGSDFHYSVDVDVSTLTAVKANNPAVEDRAVTVALGVLGSGAFSPTQFVGFKDLNDGQHYYIAIFTIQLGGDAIDPWAADSVGTLHLLEHNGDGQIDNAGTKSLKAIGNAFTFSIDGTYTAGTLELTAKVSAGGDDVAVTDSDTTPLTGTYFGMRTGAFSRSGTTAGADVTVDVDFDNVTIEKDYQPDASVAKGNGSNFKGGGIVNTSGKGQQAKLKVSAGDTANFTVRVKNIGTKSDNIVVTGAGNAAGYAVSYFDGATNITPQVTGAGYTISGLASGQQKDLKMRIQTSGGASGSKQFKVSTKSAGNSTAKDTVRTKVTIK